MIRLVVLAMGGSLLLGVLPLHAEQGSAGPAAAVARGEQVFVAQKCNVCHAVAGKGNKNGPLDEVGTKLSADDMRAWITTPVEMAKKHNATRKPPMKSYASLPKEDVDALVAYLRTLKK